MKGATCKVAIAVLVMFAHAVIAQATGASAQDQTDPASPSGLFARANSLYESGDYAGAIDAYLGVVNSGVVHATLYYNLGNSYYKVNDLGKAVLFYERSLRLAPRDRDVRENLSLVRTQLKDKQFVAEKNPVIKGISWLHDNLRTGEMFWFASLSYLLLCTLAIVFILRRTRAVSIWYRRLSLLSPARLLGLTLTQELLVAIALVSILAATSASSSYLKLQREMHPRDAVVLAREIPVFGSPTEDATLQFRIHEGTTVTAGEVRRGWVRVQLPGGLSGWVSANSIQKI
ncbi:MAG: tetratricopeptide repeat protein [Candidatus Krumholzibacteria bacterium]